jgi:CBS domain-containing protein
MDRQEVPMTGHPAPELARIARTGGSAALAAAADARTRTLVEVFVHSAGPPQADFAWVALGSHARGELHCASDQDNALVWATEQAAASSYSHDLAEHVISGLERFGLRRCDGGYMADRWSMSLAQWVEDTRRRVEAPTAQAVIDAEVFLDVRPLVGSLDLAPARAALAAGARSARLLHGLALAAVSFPPPRLRPFGWRGRWEVDLKRGGLAAIVLLARLYALAADSPAVSTTDRLAAGAPLLGRATADRLTAGFADLTRIRLEHQLADAAASRPLSDRVRIGELPDSDQDALHDAFRAIRAAQSVTSVRYRTDL